MATANYNTLTTGNVYSLPNSPKHEVLEQVPVWDGEVDPQNSPFKRFKVVQLEDWSYDDGDVTTFVPKGSVDFILLSTKSLLNLNVTLHPLDALKQKESRLWSIVKQDDCSRGQKKACLKQIGAIQNRIESLTQTK